MTNGRYYKIEHNDFMIIDRLNRKTTIETTMCFSICFV